jgi:hypothetical protein
VGCTLNNPQKNKCVTSADCNPGNTCIASVCLSLSTLQGDGGQCRESFPPASCQAPQTTYVAPKLDTLARDLPGRWLFCNTDSTYGGYKFGPAESVGLQLNGDGSWSFLFADSSGVAYVPQGPGLGGPTYDVHLTTVNSDANQVDVDLQLVDGSTYRLWTQVANDPQRLRMVNLYGGINYYVSAPPPAGCAPPDMATTGCGSGHDMSTIASPGDMSMVAPPRDLARPGDL